MTTILISTIVALSIIAFVAIMIGKWMHWQARIERPIEPPAYDPEETKKMVQAMINFATAVHELERERMAELHREISNQIENDIMGDFLVQEAKDILNQKSES